MLTHAKRTSGLHGARHAARSPREACLQQDARGGIPKADHLSALDAHAIAEDITRNAFVFFAQMLFLGRGDRRAHITHLLCGKHLVEIDV